MQACDVEHAAVHPFTVGDAGAVREACLVRRAVVGERHGPSLSTSASSIVQSLGCAGVATFACAIETFDVVCPPVPGPSDAYAMTGSPFVSRTIFA